MARWLLFVFVIAFAGSARPQAPQPKFHVLAFYSEHTEADHVEFARQALTFFKTQAAQHQFEWEATTNWDDMNEANLRHYQVVVWLNDDPHTPAQRIAFEQYMNHGGAWLGFHAAGYNDRDTGWPWFVNFLGGAVFFANNWPPLPAELAVDAPGDPVIRGLPRSYLAPANEWYLWKPDPRANKDVKVLVTLKPSNYPLGMKDTLTSGDLPVVWENTKYRMIYCNMGHGDKIFTSPVQNRLFSNAILWLGGTQAREHGHK